ncbi:thiamine-phosphate kinase [Rheinheimera nanhaiensis]|uniref:Thiamine-monophosphate kinase n=1 Tax=Rheinheimera nanhaiensis E407-8 TaxID=562729 RepID=I1E2I6_9GAMM|nr:thiamine-phosphate kinase [Rheinheimera nanhaiensis]GAB60514.1 thiamine-monophosphate kinase [Rheinheimera nanhaiensis E407-8]
MGEFELISRYFANCGAKRSDAALGVGDDGAVLQVRDGYDLVVTTDTMVVGTHFFPDDEPRALGHKLVAVNVSDLAAMGAEPAWLSLALTLPAVDEVWLSAFAAGLSETADYYQCQLVGGDTTRGPMSLTMVAKGTVPRGKALTRSGAKVGDYIYVTGTLGDAALGLKLCQGLHEVSKKHQSHILQRFHYPSARVALGQALRNLASSAMDLSDGLYSDIQHILKRSNVGASIDVSRLPLSQALKDSCDTGTALQLALSGGEDYELLFTVPEARRGSLDVLLSPYGIPVTCIGRITGVAGKLELKQGDQAFDYQHQGFVHFS